MSRALLRLSLCVLALSSTAFAQPPQLGRLDRSPSEPWSPRRALENPRARAAAATTEDGIFLFGGEDKDGPLNSVLRYDPDLDRYEARTPLPAPRTGMAAVALGRSILLLGGHDGQTSRRETWIYLPGTDQYVPTAPMIFPRSEAAATLLGDRIFVAGGLLDDGTTRRVTDRVESLGWQQGAWQLEDARLGAARAAIGSALIGSDWYLLGGADADGETVDIFERLDLVTGVVTTLSAPLGVPRSGVLLFPVPGDRLLATGGFGGSWAGARGSGIEMPMTHNGAQEYDPVQDAWMYRPNMIEARAFAAQADAGGRHYVFGGALRFGDLGQIVKERARTSVERYHPDRLPVPTAPRGSGGSGGPLGENDFNIQAFGLTRTYRLVVPASYDPAIPTRLAFFMHGSSDQNHQFQKDIGMDALAERHGFIACYPQAVDGEQHSAVVLAWEWHDWRRQNNLDIELVLSILTEVESRYNVDQERVTISGFSAGGFFTYLAGTHHGNVFAAATPYSGGDARGFQNGQPTLVHPNPLVVLQEHGRRTPMMFLHGDTDINVNIDASRRAQFELRRAGWPAQHSGFLLMPRLQHFWNRNLNEDIFGFLSQWTLSGD